MADSGESASRKRKLTLLVQWQRPQKRHRPDQNSNSNNNSSHETDTSFLYDTHELVFCYHGPKMYKAEILKRTVESTDEEPQYFVHYCGWNKCWDEWVKEFRCSKYDALSRTKKEALDKAFKAAFEKVRLKKEQQAQKEKEKKDRKQKKKNRKRQIEDSEDDTNAMTQNTSSSKRNDKQYRQSQYAQKRRLKKKDLNDLDLNTNSNETANKVNKRHKKNWKLMYHQQREVQKQYLDDLAQNKETISQLSKKCLDYKAELHSLKKEQNEEMKEMNEKHNKLQMEYDQMNDVVRLYDGKSARVHNMDMAALNHVELKLQNGLKQIQQAKQRLFDVKFKCAVCLDRTKNIVVDGCGHVTLCEQCEVALETKSCPLCLIPYTSVKKINL